MAISQKLFKIQILNFRYFLLSGRGTIHVKIKKIRDQTAWDILYFRWNDMEWPNINIGQTIQLYACIMCESIPALWASPPPPWASPWHLKKLVKCPALWAVFVGKCPSPCSFCDGQMPSPPVHSTNLQNISFHLLINITVSAQWTCIKQVTKWFTLTEQRESKWFYCFYRSSMVDRMLQNN